MKRWWTVALSGLICVMTAVVGLSLAAPAAKAGRSTVVSAGPTPPPTPASDLAIVRIAVHSQAEVDALAGSGLDLLETRGDGYLLALVNPAERQALEAAGYAVTVDAAQTVTLQLARQPSGPPGYACYRSVPAIEAYLTETAAIHPDLVQLIDFGDSWEKTMPGDAVGHDLWVLKITNRNVAPPTGRNKPRFFLMANIHARELTTPEVAMAFSDTLLDNYGSDPDITWLVDHQETWVVVTANPDGRDQAEMGLFWRKNTDNDDGCHFSSSWGVDLNRNHSFQWSLVGASAQPCSEVYHGPAPASEPEVQALETLMRSLFPDQRGPDLTDPAPLSTTGIMISLHSYGQWVLWPWGMSNLPAPNKAGLKAIGDKFATFNGYRSCQSGASDCLYQTSGASDDWAYGALGIPAYTFELGTAFFQSCGDLPDIWSENRSALLYAAKIARQPYTLGLGPDSLRLSLSPSPVGSGYAATLTAQINDYANGSRPITQAEAYVDIPPWLGGAAVPLAAVDGTFNSPRETVAGAIDTTDLALGRHLIYVRGRDADGNWGPFSAVWLEVVEPDFALAVAPAQVDVCPSATASYTVTVSSPTGGFDRPVALAVAGLPEAAVTLTPTLVTPPAAAALAVDATDLQVTGTLTFTVTGQSEGASSGEHDASAAVTVLPPPPAAAPTLMAPEDGAVEQPLRPTLAWSAVPGAAGYRVQVAVDPAFALLVADQAGLGQTQVQLATPLPAGGSLYWRAQAANACGAGPWSSPSTFSTAPLRSFLPLIAR